MLPPASAMDHGFRRHALLVLASACLFAPGRVQASEHEGPGLLFGTGWFDANRRRDQAAEARLEYRSGTLTGGLRAVAATHATTDGSLFAGAGLAYGIRIGRFDLTPSFVPGVYRRGDGRDLGYPLEFRSQLELGRRLRGGQRIAVAVSHLSNAGLGSSNPGQESLTLNFEWPGRHRNR
jgi:hypothetical protein